MPLVEARPPDHLPRSDPRPERHRRVDVPVGEVPDVEAARVASLRQVLARPVHHAALDRVHAVRVALRRVECRMRVVDRDVDAEVVAAEARVVEPSVQHVRAVQRLDRPSVIVVRVAEPEVLGERARDDRLRRSRRRAVARDDGSRAARQREPCRRDVQPMQARRGRGHLEPADPWLDRQREDQQQRRERRRPGDRLGGEDPHGGALVGRHRQRERPGARRQTAPASPSRARDDHDRRNRDDRESTGRELQAQALRHST